MVEGIVASDVPAVTAEGIGAALDGALGSLYPPTGTTYPYRIRPNLIDEVADGPAMEMAIHCVKGNDLEYEKCVGRDCLENFDNYGPPDIPETRAALSEMKEKYIRTHPRFHELFPGMFLIGESF